MKQLLLIFFAILVFQSCEREEEILINLPYKKKLISEVFLGEGDSSFSATLSYTQPIFGKPVLAEPVYATKANAQISTDGKTFQLDYDSFNFNYKGSYIPNIIKAGETYHFKASDESETTTGFVTIPQKPAFDFELQFDSSFADIYFYNATIKCTLKSNFSVNTKFVALIVFNDSSRSLLTEVTSSKVPVLKPNESVTKKLFASKSSEFVYPVRIECLGISCSDSYMLYSNATSIFNFSNIFPISEPTITYSNMSNKIGVIAAYSLSTPKKFNIQ
ncbi:MAG: DUF4249 family protein [Bacteroidia bacterium]|nr:DUF4249 family protein [Bacteroidia bacterium]